MILLKDCGYDKAQSFTSRCSLFGVDCDNATPSGDELRWSVLTFLNIMLRCDLLIRLKQLLVMQFDEVFAQ